MSSIISLLPFDLYKLYSIAVEVYYALRAFALHLTCLSLRMPQKLNR